MRRLDTLGKHRLEARARRAEREPAGAQHLEHELLVALVDPRGGQVDAIRRGAHSPLRRRPSRHLRSLVSSGEPTLTGADRLMRSVVVLILRSGAGQAGTCAPW